MDDFFLKPFTVYEKEIDDMYTAGHFKKYCSLALVIFDNSSKENVLADDITKDTRAVSKNVFEECKLNKGTSRTEMRGELDTLLKTFLRKEDDVCKTAHDKIFNFLSYYFGKKMLKCLIKNASSEFIRERFSIVGKLESSEFITEVAHCSQDMYLNRMIDNWLKGHVFNIFTNINMNFPEFRDLFFQIFRQF